MTILWCGGEDVDFSRLNPPEISTGYIDSSKSRCSLYGSLYYLSEPFTAITSGWLHSYVSIYTGASFSMGLTDSALKGIYVKTSSTNVLIQKYDGSIWTTLGTLNCLTSGGAYYYTFDLQIINYGASSTINFYLNGVFKGAFNGDCSISGVSNLYHVAANGAGAGGQANASEFIVADVDTRAMRLKTITPNAAGDTSTNWTGTYQDIDETTLDTADTVYSSTNDADFQTNLTGMPTGIYTVKAVKVFAKTLDPSATMGVQLGVKTNSTVNVGTTQACSATWETKERIMELNPVTGVAWTTAEIDALQLNIRAKVL